MTLKNRVSATLSVWLKVGFLSLMLPFMAASNSSGLTVEEMEQRIESYLVAEKSGDYAIMAGLMGVHEGELKQAISDYLERLKNYFSDRLKLQLKEIRFGGHRILFLRPERDEAFVGQEVYVYFKESGRLRRQHEYSLFRVLFDERGNIHWQPLGSSRGEFEDLGWET